MSTESVAAPIPSVLELRASVKRWEREFEASEGRKPTSTDAKANSEIWTLYQKYRAEKKTTEKKTAGQSTSAQPKPPAKSLDPLPSTPKKKTSKEPFTSSDHESDTENDEEDQSLLLQNVSEVFPTPQFRGKVLGLFDVEMSHPQTPQKPPLHEHSSQSPLASSSPCPRTPVGVSGPVETPQSKRTPDYFHYRVNLFPAGSSSLPCGDEAEPAESPLIKRRQSRTKSVTEIMREASELAVKRSTSVLADGDASASSDEGEDDGTEIPGLNMSSEPNILDTVPVMADNSAKGRGRKGPKRQTRRVVMRPIDRNNGALSTAKATDNFVRLKINNKNKRPMRRRG